MESVSENKLFTFKAPSPINIGPILTGTLSKDISDAANRISGHTIVGRKTPLIDSGCKESSVYSASRTWTLTEC